MWGCLDTSAGVQPDRCSGGQATYTNIGQPAFTVDRSAQKDMSSGRSKVSRPLPSHSCAEWRNLKSHGAQYFEQQPVLFEAVAASAIQNQLLKDVSRLERDSTAKQHVQIFERYRLYVGFCDCIQNFQSGIARAGVTNPRKVGVEIRLKRHLPSLSENS
jgi:hypothetical protein